MSRTSDEIAKKGKCPLSLARSAGVSTVEHHSTGIVRKERDRGPTSNGDGGGGERDRHWFNGNGK